MFTVGASAQFASVRFGHTVSVTVRLWVESHRAEAGQYSPDTVVLFRCRICREVCSELLRC